MCKIIHQMRQKLKRQDGAAAITVVICLVGVIVAVCLSLLLSSYQMFASVTDSAKDEDYYQQAKSFSDALKEDILGMNTELLEAKNEKREFTRKSGETTLPYYIYRLATSEHDAANGGTFTAEGKDGYGSIIVSLATEDIGIQDSSEEDSEKTEREINRSLQVTVTVKDGSGEDAEERARVVTRYQFWATGKQVKNESDQQIEVYEPMNDGPNDTKTYFTFSRYAQ